MAFNFGQFNEFSDSVTFADPVVEGVARAINLGPFTGKFYEAMGAPAATIATKEFKVYSRTLTSRNGTIDAGWDDSATTGLGIADDSLKGLTVGHVLSVGSEVVIVKKVDRSAGTIDVHKRGDGGTTAATHKANDPFDVIGFAGSDSDLKNVESVTESTKVWSNFVQTVFETIDWLKHGELLRQGLESANATLVLVREAEIRVARMLATMSIRGVKAQGTSSEGRYMSAGLLAQLGDKSRDARQYNVAGALTEAKFVAALKDAFDGGATPDTIWVSPTVKSYLNAFLGADSSVALIDQKSNHTAGGVYVDSYNYEGAILRVRVDADMPNDRIAIVNQGKCKKGWLEGDGLRMVDEPTLSSRELRKSLQGSIGFLVEDVGSDHTLLYGITGGSTERVYKVDSSGSAGGTVTAKISDTVNVKVTNTAEEPVNTKAAAGDV